MSSFPDEGHSPEDNIVLCFFMPMKWQKTAFVHSNKSLLKHTGKFAIFNLKVILNTDIGLVLTTIWK